MYVHDGTGGLKNFGFLAREMMKRDTWGLENMKEVLERFVDDEL